ncbi:hypothetical protein [Amycolatopsis sp. NPDC058986]|uniref:hypothetical protein n=1 Tax=unclassified Amycolatopsis TaxID=2618356 RepID=UPI003672E527
MQKFVRFLAPIALVFATFFTVVPTASALAAEPAAVAAPFGEQLDCVAGNNHAEIAAKFISRCKKGSIRREFPSDRLSRSLGQIYAGKQAGDRDDVKAWKLLNDKRFDK